MLRAKQFTTRRIPTNKFYTTQNVVRTRFAPSPTGFMHLGALRTSLYNYLYAKQADGAFILRIEDTDQKRLVDGSVDQIKKTLAWCNMKFDEFYVQSERTKIYQEHAYMLLEKGHAYKCYCTEERLKRMREDERRGMDGKYDRHCLALSKQEILELDKNKTPYTIRMKIPYNSDDNTQQDDMTIIDDQVFGKIYVKNNTVDDQVLLKSDGYPTYHLANVVDDHLMGITHVIRGMEWISSTPKHMILYDMFGWKSPTFAHLPLLCTQDNQKLSKRHGHASVDWYRERGYLPEAMVNFVAFLGWSPKDASKEIFTMQELIQQFSMDRLNKANSTVNLKKLEWINSQHIRLAIEHNIDQVLEELRPKMKAKFDHPISDDYLKLVLHATRDRIKNYSYFADYFGYFFDKVKYDTDEAKKFYQEKVAKVSQKDIILQSVIQGLANVPSTEYNEASINHIINQLKEQGISYQDIVHVLRYYATGSSIGSGITQTLYALGQGVSVDRLKQGITKL